MILGSCSVCYGSIPLSEESGFARLKMGSSLTSALGFLILEEASINVEPSSAIVFLMKRDLP